MFCPNCGTENGEHKFCVKCGAALKEKEPEKTEIQPVQKHKKKHGVLIGTIIVFLILAAGGIWFWKKELSVQQIVEKVKEVFSREKIVKEAEEEEEKRGVSEFPKELLGAWKEVRSENKGAVSLEMPDLEFYPNGNLLLESELFDLLVSGNEFVITSLEEDNDWKFTWKLEDIVDTENEYFREGGAGRTEFENVYKIFYEKYKSDRLILSVTGTLDGKEIDSDLIYERDYAADKVYWWLSRFLLGNWRDNSGNTWEFIWGEKSVDIRLRQEDGTEWRGSISGINMDSRVGVPELEFSMEEPYTDVGLFTLVELEGNKIVFGTGNNLVELVREDEGGMPSLGEKN